MVLSQLSTPGDGDGERDQNLPLGLSKRLRLRLRLRLLVADAGHRSGSDCALERPAVELSARVSCDVEVKNLDMYLEPLDFFPPLIFLILLEFYRRK